MATTQVKEVAVIGDDKHKRTRSPAYPFIGLEAAIERAKQFYAEEQQLAANLKVAIKHWDYEAKSSGGLQTAAALVAFGLMKDEGMGDRRKLQLTPQAICILESPNPTDRENAIKQAALAPKIHRQIWERWNGKLPSDESLKFTLITDWEPKFNANSVDGFIKQFRSTISFAKLIQSDTVKAEDGNSEEAGGAKYVPKVGDYIQWESQGTLQCKEPVKVIAISTDGTHAFVEGTSTGLPVGQLRHVEAPQVVPQTQIVRTSLLTTTTVQEDVYSLPEGRVVVQWPSALSAESIQEVKDYLKLLERKIVRSLTKEEQA